MRLARLAWLSLLAALALAGCERAENTGATSIDEWLGFGNTGAEQHYSALDQIGTGNVADLKLAWFADLPHGNSATGPVMAQGKLFVTTGHGHVRAFDATSGEPAWDRDSGAREASKGLQMRLGWGPKGLAYADGRVFPEIDDASLEAIRHYLRLRAQQYAAEKKEKSA